MSAPETAPKVLGIDLDKGGQVPIAKAFNQAGLFYRFISEPKKLAGAMNQLKPQLVVLYDEIGSDLVNNVLEILSGDVEWAHLPVVIICGDTEDRTFVLGLRTGVVAVLPRQFDGNKHPSGIKHVLAELPTRQGSTSGSSDSKQLARLVEHLRKTCRSGPLTFDRRTPNEGNATVLLGKLEKASYKKLQGTLGVARDAFRRGLMYRTYAPLQPPPLSPVKHLLLIIALLTCTLSGGCCLWRQQNPVSDSVVASRQFAQQGLNALERSNLSEAEKYSSQAVRACPSDPNARRSYADVLWAQGRTQEALEQIDAALVSGVGGDIETRLRAAEMRFQAGKLDAALVDVEQVIDADPKSAEAWALRGRVMLANGNAKAIFGRHAAIAHLRAA